MYLSSCVCEGACVSPRTPCLYMHLCVEVRVSFYGTTHLFKRIGSFPGLDFAKNARLAGHQGLGSTCPCLPTGGYALVPVQWDSVSECGLWRWTSSPQACKMSILQPEASPRTSFFPRYVQLFGGGAVILREIWTWHDSDMQTPAGV